MLMHLYQFVFQLISIYLIFDITLFATSLEKYRVLGKSEYYVKGVIKKLKIEKAAILK